MSVGVSVREPKRDADINILGALNLLEAAVRHGVRRLIFASTGGAMYGDQALPPTPETVFPEPVSPYGVAKLAVERYLHAFRVMHGLEAVALRYANVYGPRQNPHGEAGVVAIFSRAIVADQAFTINGDGGQTRDYTYVGDVVQAVLLAAALRVEDRLPILNIGTGLETSVTDLVTILQDDRRPAAPVPARAGQARGAAPQRPGRRPSPSGSSAGGRRWTSGPAWNGRSPGSANAPGRPRTSKRGMAPGRPPLAGVVNRAPAEGQQWNPSRFTSSCVRAEGRAHIRAPRTFTPSSRRRCYERSSSRRSG